MCNRLIIATICSKQDQNDKLSWALFASDLLQLAMNK